MIVPRHIKCDYCGEEDEYAKYFTIPSRQKVIFGCDSWTTDRYRYHLCSNCFWKLRNNLVTQEEENKE